MEDFSETSGPTPAGQSDFILLPSQEETQQESQHEAEMKKILTRLPALQCPTTKARQLLLGDSTEEEPETAASGGRVLVPDTEYNPHTEPDPQSECVSDSQDDDGVTAPPKKKPGKILVSDTDFDDITEHTTGPSDFVSESEEVSDGPVDVTVVERRQLAVDKSEEELEPMSPIEPNHTPPPGKLRGSRSSSASNESSFQSKNRSNLGSYDQCELYTTQKGHAKGSRFNLFASSQEDMFAESAAGETEKEHIASLHLSLEPMMIPETVEESESLIPPSPGVYGSTPMIIPDSPTQGKPSGEDDGPIFDVNAANTFESGSKGFTDSSNVVVELEVEASDKNTPYSQRQSKSAASLDIQEALQIPTLMDNGKSESLHLHMSDSTPMESAPSLQVLEERVSGQDCIAVTEQSKTGDGSQEKDPCIGGNDKPLSRTSPDDVIVIESGSRQTQHDDDSQQFVLHLSPSQGGSTQGRRTQGALSQRDRNKYSQGHRSSGGQRSQGESSQGQRSQGNGRSRREEREIRNINENPIVVWKDESDTGNFHLSLPKNSTLSNPANGNTELSNREQGGDQQQESINVMDIDKAGICPNKGDNGNTELSSREVGADQQQESIAVIDIVKAGICHNKGDKEQTGGEEMAICEENERECLTIGMLQSESETISQPVFKLDRPDIQDTDISEDVPEDLFSKTVSRHTRPHTKHVLLEDDSDDEILLFSDDEDVTNHHTRVSEPVVANLADLNEPAADLWDDVKLADLPKSSVTSREDIQSPDSNENIFKSREVTKQEDKEAVILKDVNKVDIFCEDTVESKDITKLADSEDVVKTDQEHLKQPENPDINPQHEDDELPTVSCQIKKDINQEQSGDLSNVEKRLTEGTDIQEGMEDEILVAHKLNTVAEASESVERTQLYYPGASKLIESSTQTADKVGGDFEDVDVNVVQKVAEYLQAGYTPQSRSRSNSTCTDLSDLHGEGSEKGDGQSSKTPQRKSSTDKWKAPMSRRDSCDVKSPKEIKDIIKTYSDILAKKRTRHKSKSEDSRKDDKLLSSSQRPNPLSESPSGQKLLPRRLSTQSLPTDLVTSRNNEQSDGRNIKPKNINQSDTIDPWMTARKPQSQLSTGSERNSEKTIGSPNKKSGITQEMDTVLRVSVSEPAIVPCSVTQSDLDKVDESALSPKVPKTTQSSNGGLNKENFNKSTPSNCAAMGVENVNFLSSPVNKIQSETVQNKSTLIETRTAVVVLDKLQEGDIHGKKQKPVIQTDVKRHLRRRHALTKQKAKKLISSAERNQRRRSIDCVSPQIPSGSFVASTQKFRPAGGTVDSLPVISQGSRSGGVRDTYTFHGSQSQMSPGETCTPKHDSVSSSLDETPLSSRKRRLQHRKSGLKKQRIEINKSPTNHPVKHHVSFKPIASPVPIPHDQAVSQASDVTVTTIGSFPSIPSSISQSSPRRDVVLSPSSSSSRQSVSEEISTRLSGKRMSLEQSLPDTIPLQQSEEDNYQRVTIVTETVETLYREIKTTRKVVGLQGQVMESSVDVKKMDPVVVEESTHKKVQYVYIPSPSRSVTSLTSGDLGDISSSLSRSSASSFSRSSGSVGLGSKVNSVQSSLDHSDPHGRILETQTSLDHPEAVVSKIESQSNVQTPVGKDGEKSEEKTDNAAVTNKPVSHKTPTVVEGGSSKPFTPGLSDQDGSGVMTPLGSTINKTGSYLHSRTASVESLKTSESLFTSSGEKEHKESSENNKNRKQQTPPCSGKVALQMERQTSSNSDISPQIPNQDVDKEAPDQDHVVSSSAETALVPSSGAIGSRVIAKWKDGFYYPGIMKSSADRNSKCAVKFDDGDSRAVKLGEILLIEKLPVGQSVMVLNKDGYFESGMISQLLTQHYVVETDDGISGRYNFSQVILTADQASCIISDVGHEIMMTLPGQPGPLTNIGDISLENLIDAPRRSTKKQQLLPEIKLEKESRDQGQSTKGRKRKIDELRPQATSTPTPKGKVESNLKRRKAEGVFEESPIGTAHGSPLSARMLPRKTRVELFTGDMGPIPQKNIFKGITFFLTHVQKTAEQREQERKLLEDSSLETSTDESANEEELGAPFDKAHLKTQIEAGGGTLLENLDEKMVSRGKKKCILLSSSYQKTLKYFQCLACGIPCISHMWLANSCSQGRLLDEKSYVLPAGISLEKRKLMEWKGKKDTFVGIKAIVHSKNAKFVESWTTIMQLAKCQVYKQLQYTDVHVIVTDNTCLATVKRQAGNHSIPLVSTEWIIQSLVNSRVVAYDGHPRYRYDFVI